MFKKKSIAKKIREITNKGKEQTYDLNYILKEMREYYSENEFKNTELLKRLREIKVNNSFMDMFNGALIGVIVTEFIGEIPESIFENYVPTKSNIIIFFVTVIIMAIVAILILIVLQLSYLKVAKSRDLTDYIDEKEVELINEILDKEIKENEKVILKK